MHVDDAVEVIGDASWRDDVQIEQQIMVRARSERIRILTLIIAKHSELVLKTAIEWPPAADINAVGMYIYSLVNIKHVGLLPGETIKFAYC